MTIQINEDLTFVYWSDRENEIHGEPITKDNKDYWIKLAAEHSSY